MIVVLHVHYAEMLAHFLLCTITVVILVLLPVSSLELLQFRTTPFSAARDVKLPVNVRVELMQVESLLWLSVRDTLVTLSAGISVEPECTDTLIEPVHTELAQEIAAPSLLQV